MEPACSVSVQKNNSGCFAEPSCPPGALLRLSAWKGHQWARKVLTLMARAIAAAGRDPGGPVWGRGKGSWVRREEDKEDTRCYRAPGKPKLAPLLPPAHSQASPQSLGPAQCVHTHTCVHTVTCVHPNVWLHMVRFGVCLNETNSLCI